MHFHTCIRTYLLTDRHTYVQTYIDIGIHAYIKQKHSVMMLYSIQVSNIMTEQHLNANFTNLHKKFIK